MVSVVPGGSWWVLATPGNSWRQDTISKIESNIAGESIPLMFGVLPRDHLALSLGFCREIAKRDHCGCSLAHGCSPKHCFYRAKWTSKIRPPKVCSFIVKIVCVVRKSLKNPSNIAIIALGKAFLSFSLRFCSTFKKHCKSRLKIEILPFKGDTLHTCSHEKRNFEVQL